MAKRRFGRLWVLGVLALIAVWSFYQIVHSLHGRGGSQEDAGRLLFQAASFQMELLSSYVNEAAGAANTADLNELKQVAYSAGYTHERLATAYAEDHMTDLQSVGLLLQYIMRLQLGGSHVLKQEEKEALTELQKPVRELYDQYAKLVSPSGRLIASQNEKVEKADRTLVDLLRKEVLK